MFYFDFEVVQNTCNKNWQNFELVCKEIYDKIYNILFNPLTPRRTQVSPFAEISILF